MKLYELTVNDSEDSVFAISLVENPAIEMDFMAFNKQKENIQFASINNEQRKLIGAILVPDKKILRIDDSDNSTYQVYFSKETVAKLAQNYLKDKYTGNATLEHASKTKGIALVESWIKTGKFDKSNNYGFNVPDGTWMGIFQVDSTPAGDKLWNDYIKTGKVKGFSVEAYLSHKLVKASMEQILEKDVTELSEVEAQAVLRKLKHIIKKDNRFKKGQRIDVYDMEGEGGANPSIPNSSYPGQAGPGKKKKAKEAYIHPALLGTKK